MLANLLMSASTTMIMPFLSLYIETFGDHDPAYVQKWAGYIFGVTFLVAFIFSPIWGRIGDRFGYKKNSHLHLVWDVHQYFSNGICSFRYIFTYFTDFYGDCNWFYRDFKRFYCTANG
ncbi:hypothetical protein MCOL2_03446 [Listeria fleischmannii FSL S10-1203]|uniref:Uncharacterized protein n=1 Tax=Listeria fleischmannii FSL S10-1203 TaxID=1265822 RepID=W7DR89_9LIST|nr:hypothetical protein MCOL2_03446 [Listeria fleischmannii FSL S10-1203]